MQDSSTSFIPATFSNEKDRVRNNIKIILVDFSYTLCFPRTKESIDSLMGLYGKIIKKDSTSNPLDSFIINKELLSFLKTLRGNYKLHIFTSGSMHTDPTIFKYLQPVFDGYITSSELQLPKSFPNAYKVIANKLGVSIETILFIDDQQKNIDAAKTAGCNAIRFTNTASVIESIRNNLSK